MESWTVKISNSNPRNNREYTFDTKAEAVTEARDHLNQDGCDADITVLDPAGKPVACATASDSRLTWIK